VGSPSGPETRPAAEKTGQLEPMALFAAAETQENDSMRGIEVAGFARLLAQCDSFRGVPVEMLEKKLTEGARPLSIRILPPSAQPILCSGQHMDSLLFIQFGAVVPWQMPYSVLRQPYLLGEHEVLLAPDRPRWVAHYSAIVETTVIELPLVTMRGLLSVQQIRENIELRVLRRLARYYWTSLSTTGTPESKVAAALVSRLVLNNEDSGKNRRIQAIGQRELVRLTATSRAGVSQGLRALQEQGVILFTDPKRANYLAGDLLVSDVDQLKAKAFSEIRRDVERLLPGHDSSRAAETPVRRGRTDSSDSE